jgi:hypothetical protein
MSKSILEQEIHYGLENLSKVYERVTYFSSVDAVQAIKLSALTYECLGYYNAIEHLIIRFIKHLNLDLPSGALSHCDIFRVFERLLTKQQVEIEEKTLRAIAEFMAFRHVATKIYGFLTDEAKLNVIVARIGVEHTNIVLIVQQLLASI